MAAAAPPPPAMPPRRYPFSSARRASESPAAVFASDANSVPPGFEGYRQRRQSAQAGVGPPCKRARGEREIRQAAQDRLESNLALDARERRAETKVGGPSECQVLVVGAVEDELVRIGKTLGIAVGRRHDRHHRLSLADLFVSHLHVLAGNSSGVLARAFIPE